MGGTPVLVVAMVACTHAPSPPERVHPPVLLHSNRAPTVRRPQIATRAFSFRPATLEPGDELWPLTRTPALEPHAPLDVIYRGAGPWTALCERRGEAHGVDRDEALAYLLAWCGMQVTGLDPLRDALRPLVNAQSNAIGYAARADLIDVLAAGSPVSALRWLEASSLSDAGFLDELAASYLAMGREADARAIVAVMARSRWLVRTLDCRSLYRVRSLLHEPWIRDDIEERKPTEPTCARMAGILDDQDIERKCPLLVPDAPKAGCTAKDCTAIDRALSSCGELGTRPDAHLALAFEAWPSLERDEQVWLGYARYVMQSLAEPGADKLALAALENAASVIECGKDLHEIVELAQVLAANAPGLRTRLDPLLQLTPSTCTKAHAN